MNFGAFLLIFDVNQVLHCDGFSGLFLTAFDIGYKGIEASDAILPVVGIEIFLIDPAFKNFSQEKAFVWAGA